MCERSCGVACRLYNERAFLFLVYPGAYGKRFRLFKGAGLHLSSYLRVVSAECDVQVVQAEILGKSFGFIGDRGAGILQSPLYRHPVGISVYAFQFLPRVELRRCIDGPHQGRIATFRVAESPSGIIENPSCLNVLQTVLGRLEFCQLHIRV